MKKLIVFFFSIYYSTICFATHNRAGEITYRQISSYTFEITLTTYTYTPSYANESRDVLPIDWGDGTISNIPRISQLNLPDEYTKNTYRMLHTFPGPGNYEIIMEDPNRNEGVVNIFESVNIPFSISSTLRIDPILGSNSTPILLNPPVDKAALGQKFIHNPAAYDPDGDSLSYKLTVCTGQNGEPIAGYTFPEASNQFFVDSITGDLIWDAPVELGVYNVAMVVEEWRNGVKIGTVKRDIQIQVIETNNHTPIFSVMQNICIRAGDTLTFDVRATDIDGDSLVLTASGGPLESISNTAYFPTVSGSTNVEGEFTWVPSCSEVREQPYVVVFKASDVRSEVSLAALQYVNITVIGHPPIITELQPVSNGILISWEDTICRNCLNYSIYRSISPVNYVISYCETGLPNGLQSEYQLIATVDSSLSNYIDNNNGLGLSPGFTYCYRMLSNYVDSFPSYISNETCLEYLPTVPVITNVSIINTDEIEGKVMVKWTKPIIAIASAYFYKLYRIIQNQGERVLVATITNENDTSYVDSLINTKINQIYYEVELYSNTIINPIFEGVSPRVSSPFIQLYGENKKIKILVSAEVSWVNDSVYVYRKNNATDDFEYIGLCNDGEYIDSGLVNLQDFCYYVTTSGFFNSSFLPARVYNNSQIACTMPIDTIAPEVPKFTIFQNCDSLYRKVRWNSLNNDEVKSVGIYFKNCRDTVFKRIALVSSSDTVFIHNFSDSTSNMAGCYYVSFIDSSGNKSMYNNDTCMFNCPVYILPNIFTPNNDGENEIYHPYKNRFVESIDISIYDSWGQLVFQTIDSDINWNGVSQQTNMQCADGVFYYVCDVYEYWSDCSIQPRTLVGFIHKFSNPNSSNE